MNQNDLLTLLVAFVLGYFAHQMMRNMCGSRLVEGTEEKCNSFFNHGYNIAPGACASLNDDPLCIKSIGIGAIDGYSTCTTDHDVDFESTITSYYKTHDFNLKYKQSFDCVSDKSCDWDTNVNYTGSKGTLPKNNDDRNWSH